MTSIIFESRYNHYENECEGRLITCECKEDIKIKDMSEHLKNDCIVAIHPCRYKDFGCDYRGTNAELLLHHLDEKLHFRLLESAAFALKKSNERLIQLWPIASGYKLPKEFQPSIESKNEVPIPYSYGPPEACMNISSWKIAKQASKQQPIAGPKVPHLKSYAPVAVMNNQQVPVNLGPPRAAWAGFYP